jgi:hypothetical protein
MSDEESSSSQPPALEDAEIDDVSSDASFVSDSSASVSIATDASGDYSDGEGDDDGPDNNALGKPFIVPLKAEADESIVSPNGSRRPSKGREDALERNTIRRQSSSKMLGAMRAAGRNMGDEPRRRTSRPKSGDEEGDETPRRRPPPRTKSGEGMVSPRAELQSNHPEDDEELISPRDKDEILERNMARRQKSSEMLLAMRDSTRKSPARSKSSGAALQRRPPPRTTSASPRRPPPRTKSGDGMSAPTRGLQRTKSGDVPRPP